MRVNFTSLSLTSALVFICLIQQAYGQVGGYEASRDAGILAMGQNPASAIASVYKSQFNIAAGSFAAGNNHFFTNDFDVFLPHTLLRNIGSLSNSQSFLNDLSKRIYFSNSNSLSPWNGFTQNRVIGPGGFWRLDLNPDWVERGLSRMSFGIWVERSEILQYQDIDESLIRPIESGVFSNVETYQASDDYFSIKYRERDALALNYAVTVGKGNKMFHIAIGGKLLGAGAFMDLQSYGLSLSNNSLGQIFISADSIALAYNPSFSAGFGGDEDRRFKNFENSWGIEGNIGFIFQAVNYNREPFFEVGAGIHGLGAIQYWNLTNRRYLVSEVLFPSSSLKPSDQTIVDYEQTLQTVSTSVEDKFEGVSESLPLRITAHAKLQLTSVLGVQLNAQANQGMIQSDWNVRLRGTFCIERDKGFSFYFPVSSSLDFEPIGGFYVAFNHGLVVGSEDIFTNIFRSATRKGVNHSHLFMALHIPINRDF